MIHIRAHTCTLNIKQLGIPEIPVIVTTKANPRAQGMEVMRPATLDTSGLKTGQTYSFSELGLEQRLKTPKETQMCRN